MVLRRDLLLKNQTLLVMQLRVYICWRVLRVLPPGGPRHNGVGAGSALGATLADLIPPPRGGPTLVQIWSVRGSVPVERRAFCEVKTFL